MSFSKSKSKRFAEPVSHGPPVGIYDVTKVADKSSGPVTFDRESRFTEKKDQTPGPADTQADVVTCLNFSNASIDSAVVFATPSKPVKRSGKQKSLSNADLSCKETTSQQIHHLQYKISELEKSLERTAKDKAATEKNLKAVCKEKDEIFGRLQELLAECGVSVQVRAELESCQKELSILKLTNIELECEKKNLETDLEQGKQDENALLVEISNLVSLYQVLNDQRDSDEDLLNVNAKLQENKSILTAQQIILQLKQEIERQLSQTKIARTYLADLEKKYEEICKERQSLEDNCFNLERVKEFLEEQKTQLTEDLERTRIEKADLEEQLENLESTTTESLRGMTLRYQDLEDSNATMREAFENREAMLHSELEVTKQSHQSVKDDLDVMKNTYMALQQNYDTVATEADEFAKKLEEAENAIFKIKAENEEKNKTIENNNREHGKEKAMLVANVEKLENEVEAKGIQILNQQGDISSLKSSNAEIEDEKELLFRKLEQVNDDIQRKNEELKETKLEMQNTLSIKETSLAQITEELERRIVEVQTQLATSEHNFKSKLEAEQESYSQLLEEHERLRSGEIIEDLKKEAELWKSKFDELETKVRPFQTQLELFEQEKSALMSENNWRESEIAKLAERYAQILGHQNNKQKIHHIVKIKEENLALKKEVSKLRTQLNREKVSKNTKPNSPKVPRKSRFDPSKAFQHNGKENANIRPLTELNDNNI